MPSPRRAALALSVLSVAAPALIAANIPRPAPDFTIYMPDGSKTKLSQYKGKVVALAFILTSCPHCQKAVRSLSQAQKDFGPRGFQALASAVEDMAQIHVPEFIRQFKPAFPVGYGSVRPALDFMQHPPMLNPLMPMIVFIDRAGVIRSQHEGHEPFFTEDQMEKNIRTRIADMLKTTEPASKKSLSKKKK